MTKNTLAKNQNIVGTRRVLIVEDEIIAARGLRTSVEKLGHTVVGEAEEPRAALALFDEHQPDLVLMDIQLHDHDGIELAQAMLEKRRCPIILISAHSDDALHARANAAGVFGYHVKPATPASLGAQIAVSIRCFNEAESLRDQNQSLTETLEARKLIERAKGILMKRFNLDEATAHKMLQTESQKRRANISDVARHVIASKP